MPESAATVISEDWAPRHEHKPRKDVPGLAGLVHPRDDRPGDPMQLLNVVLVEDHLALRKGIELLLQRSGVRVVGAADSARSAYELILRRRPHAAVIDIALPDESGVALTRRLLDQDPELPILLYTGLEDRASLLAGLDSGARGFAMKAGSPAELVRAIRVVANGGNYIDPKLRPLMLEPLPAGASRGLSPREREVLGWLAQGLTGEEIAARLHLSAETVRTHVRNAMDKLGARTRVQAIVLALRKGEIRL